MPLFPLRQVLVPGLILPLNIFEPRYVAMIRDLAQLPPHERTFGVVALRQGRDAGTEHRPEHLHEVGCTALIREIDEQEDGRFLVATAGAVRFRLHDLDATGKPYLTGLVSALDEPDGEDDPEALEQLALGVAGSWDDYRERLGIAASGLPDTSVPAPVVLSYLVVAGMVLDLPERQSLLEIPDTASRLRAERRLLRREQVLIDELHSLPAIDLAATENSPN